MRIVGVLGAIGVGVAIGSATIFAPLMLGSSGGSPKASLPGGTAADQTAQTSSESWGAQWGQQAKSFARALTGGRTAKRTADSEADVVAGSAPAKSGQDAKTIDYLAHGTSNDATIADAKSVEKPWVQQLAVAPEAAGPSRKMTSSKPSSDEQRQQLVFDLQTELKRVGCYEGEPNGQWGAASKKAMSAFTDRVNASLPFEQPDFILLTLVQGHKGRACGAAPAARGTTVASETPRPAKPQARPAVASAWNTTVQPAAPAPATTGTIPARKQPATEVAEAPAAPSNPVAELPGRMSIGAPAAAPSQTPAELAPVAPAAPPATKAAAAPASRYRYAAVEIDTRPDRNLTPPPAATHSGLPHRDGVRVRRPLAAAVAPVVPPGPAGQQRPVIVRRPLPAVTVHRLQPQVRYYAQQSPAAINGGSRSRRLVYDMFQRPDRN